VFEIITVQYGKDWQDIYTEFVVSNSASQ